MGSTFGAEDYADDVCTFHIMYVISHVDTWSGQLRFILLARCTYDISRLILSAFGFPVLFIMAETQEGSSC